MIRGLTASLLDGEEEKDDVEEDAAVKSRSRTAKLKASGPRQRAESHFSPCCLVETGPTELQNDLARGVNCKDLGRLTSISSRPCG